MLLNTLLRFDWHAKLHAAARNVNDNSLILEYLRDVQFTIRSDGTSTIKLLSPEPLTQSYVLTELTAPDGTQPFTSIADSEGQQWQVTHSEPIVDPFGTIQYYFQHVKRVS